MIATMTQTRTGINLAALKRLNRIKDRSTPEAMIAELIAISGPHMTLIDLIDGLMLQAEGRADRREVDDKTYRAMQAELEALREWVRFD